MTDSTAHTTADNMRADFLNASNNWQRWKILNRALGWAVTATENADAARHALQEWEAEAQSRVNATAASAGTDKDALDHLMRRTLEYLRHGVDGRSLR